MRNKPRIRFKGFTEDWEQRKLGDVANVRDGTHDSPKFYNDGFPLVTSKNLKDGSIDFSDCSFISEQDFDEINKRSKVDPGDILFGMIGTIGKPAIVEYTGFAIKNVALIKEGNIINNRFIYHLLSSKVFDNYIARENAGGTQKFIALNQIRNFIFSAPTLAEQNKIIELLDYISQIITLHQRKLEKLKLAKKALLQKLFPKNGSKFPELRFKGFADAWEQCKLDELTISIGDGLHGTPKYDENGSYYFINGNNLVDSKVSVTAETKKVAFEALSNDDRRLDSTSILMSINGTIGTLARYNNENIMLGKSVAYITPKNINRDFLFYQLQGNVIQSYFYKNLTGTTIKNLGLGTIKNAIVMSTLSEEESKIGQFFYKLDQFITLHQRKLDKLQEVKKGLLQKMFV